MEKPIILLDARNLLYRAIYAAKAEKYNKYHSIVFLLRMISTYIRHFDPVAINVFWDAPRDTVWRKQILSSYKDRTNSTYVEDISLDLISCTSICHELFKFMNIRQFAKNNMEADDLIYTATTVLHPKRTMIISSDSDMMQIPFLYSSNSVVDPKNLTINSVPDYNPAMMKAIIGDKSDCIDGYYGIGPKKGAMLLENYSQLKEFMDIKGKEIYIRNLLLTDLSLCPKLLNNKIYVQKVLSTTIGFDREEIMRISRENKIYGMEGEYYNIIPPFQKLN